MIFPTYEQLISEINKRHEQSKMIRTECSPNGWICRECRWKEHPEYEVEFDD